MELLELRDAQPGDTCFVSVSGKGFSPVTIASVTLFGEGCKRVTAEVDTVTYYFDLTPHTCVTSDTGFRLNEDGKKMGPGWPKKVFYGPRLKTQSWVEHCKAGARVYDLEKALQRYTHRRRPIEELNLIASTLEKLLKELDCEDVTEDS